METKDINQLQCRSAPNNGLVNRQLLTRGRTTPKTTKQTDWRSIHQRIKSAHLTQTDKEVMGEMLKGMERIQFSPDKAAEWIERSIEVSKSTSRENALMAREITAVFSGKQA